MSRYTNNSKEKERVKAWKIRNSEKWKIVQAKSKRKGRLRDNFGITPEQYEEMARSQDNRCALCPNTHTELHRLSVDHDHKTGKVRGLLCGTCNRKLGVYETNKQKFEEYLKQHG